MNFAKTTYGGTVEILASKDFQAIPVKVAGSSVVKAGTPLTAAGESTTGSGAIGILLYDVDPTKNPNAAAVVQGIIDATKAQAHRLVSDGNNRFGIDCRRETTLKTRRLGENRG